MRYPWDLSQKGWTNFIIKELPDDPEYKGTEKSAAASKVLKMAHQIESLRDDKKGQAKQLRHMERRNVKLNQKITRLIKQLKKIRTKARKSDHVSLEDSTNKRLIDKAEDETRRYGAICADTAEELLRRLDLPDKILKAELSKKRYSGVRRNEPDE